MLPQVAWPFVALKRWSTTTKPTWVACIQHHLAHYKIDDSYPLGGATCYNCDERTVFP
jgi:hypothetical protein